MLTDLIVRTLEYTGSALVADLPEPDASDPPRSDGQPVVVVGGLATTAPVLEPLAGWLAGLGYRVHPLAIGAGLDCATRSVEAVSGHVREVARTSGRPVVLVGYSRGGQFARVAAARTPHDVAGLVTLGTPFDLFRLGGPVLLAAGALVAAGSAGLPGLARLSCLFGSCCREFRAQLRGPWPSDIPFTSIYSAADRVVPARASIDPAARNVEVPGSHIELLTGVSARAAVADALTR
ncbi:MAG: alpha/beta hydrolase, partial [Actinomycetota bacterium]|nr:alpha/beta hydrolase [Actinomycetota bacterium]